MKIALYTYTLNKKSGGALDAMLLLQKGFLELGYEVFFILHKKTDEDIKVDVPIFLIKTNFGDLARPFLLRSVIKKQAPDVIFSDMKPQNFNASFAKWLLINPQTKFIGIERNPDLAIRYKKRKIAKKIIAKIYENLDMIVCVSKAVKLDLQNAFGMLDKKLCVIYDSVDFAKIEQKLKESIPKEHEYIYERDVIINVGRLATQKGQEFLLESFSLLPRGKFHLVILGDGDKKDFLTQKAQDLKISEEVFFLGHKDNVFSYMARSKLFVLTSNYEGFGKVIVESIACKTPVIAFNSIGGHNEILEVTKQALIPHKDTKKLSNQILAHIDDKNALDELLEKQFNALVRFTYEKHLKDFIQCLH